MTLRIAARLVAEEGREPAPMLRSSATKRRRLPVTWSATLVLLLGCAPWAAVSANSPDADDPDAPAAVADSAEKEPPPISLESLYHPEQRFDYDGQTPATHWLEDEPPRLLIRRDADWMQVDPTSGEETPFEPAKRLAERLDAIEGVDEAEAVSAANRAVTSLKKSTDPVLVRVGKSLAVVSTSTPARILTQDASSWGNVQLDPSGRRVAYTRQGDLFLVDINSQRSIQLTRDGSETLLDGVLDWTYQEEIFGRGNFRGFWFSPDGERLAMLRIDIGGIEPYLLGSSEAPRGQADATRYPKAGDPIPHAVLVLWDLSRFDQAVIPAPRLIERSSPSRERIITGVWWHSHRRRLLYSVSDRVQSWRELRFVDLDALQAASGESQLLLREESPAWVEPPSEPAFLSDGGVVWRSELPTGRHQLYRVSADGAAVAPLNIGEFSVRSFFMPPEGNFALVTGDVESRTVQQHLYRVDTSDWGATAVTEPLALNRITEPPGWHGVSISPDGQHFVDSWSTASAPPRLRLQPTVPGAEESSIHDLHTTELLVPGEMIEPEFVEIVTDDGIPLPAMIVRPRDADERGGPLAVVIETYGGPQAPVVANRWAGTQALYRELLARSGIATLVVDNRSSAGRSMADTWSIHRRFGKVELQDLMTAVEWLKQQTWVDEDRIGLRGWSYGGYLTLYALTHSDAFAAGIAGGSVSDFREYDAFYTERYMGLPDDNPDGYDSTDVTRVAEKLHGRLLMIHGEIDDNVHPLGTLRMARALQNAGKQFDLMIYPGNAHGIHQPNQAWHLVNLTHQFLLETLGPDD